MSEPKYQPISYRILLFQKLHMCFGILLQLTQGESTARIWLRPTYIQSVPEKKGEKNHQPATTPYFARVWDSGQDLSLAPLLNLGQTSGLILWEPDRYNNRVKLT